VSPRRHPLVGIEIPCSRSGVGDFRTPPCVPTIAVASRFLATPRCSRSGLTGFPNYGRDLRLRAILASWMPIVSQDFVTPRVPDLSESTLACE
jgi:hypothetical protein